MGVPPLIQTQVAMQQKLQSMLRSKTLRNSNVQAKHLLVSLQTKKLQWTVVAIRLSNNIPPTLKCPAKNGNVSTKKTLENRLSAT